MTAIRTSNGASRRRGGGDAFSESTKARLFLALACLWPFCLLALFTASAPHVDTDSVASPHRAVNIGKTFRGVLDRVDVMGYGPTHPRTAIVITGDDKDNIVATTESVFANTDLNRIFVVVVVVDGHKEDAEFTQQLQKMDGGSIPHWHGLRPDIHSVQENDEGEHGRRMHVIYNERRHGVTESRSDAIDFIKILEKHHEENGLKTEEEDLILLLLQGGAQLTVCVVRWTRVATLLRFKVKFVVLIPTPLFSLCSLENG